MKTADNVVIVIGLLIILIAGIVASLSWFTICVMIADFFAPMFSLWQWLLIAIVSTFVTVMIGAALSS